MWNVTNDYIPEWIELCEVLAYNPAHQHSPSVFEAFQTCLVRKQIK